ncbi:MAG: hypothetical protein A3G27_07290 [Betaproteobacteria bacterium RIFCSPLOWO2_12_FULL_66_14]|nr:MAG: hypothetical protein A3G27_07290 [Betaproteobacteria bacterium RIFCSPLOWO2_12_FULL_66_14]
MTQRLRLVFGDIHNHNAHGYGRGSIERSVDIARRHLDFFAFTGHSSWHDLGDYGGRARHFIEGFRRLKETWTHIQKVIADANNDGRFCSFLGFEWHSNRYGDQCVVFPNDHQPLFYTSELKELRRFCLERSALMIPHHLAYPQGRRGVDWESFAPDCTPVVEVFSWHGNGEEDRGLYPFVGGSPGGRQTAGTARAGLARGLQFGFVASSDNHSGFPGAYGEGLMGAYVSELTRPAIIDAIQRRRTYALTGDRIEMDFRVDGHLMGSEIDAGRQVEVSCDIAARDEIDSVDLGLNGETISRAWLEPSSPQLAKTLNSEPYQVRFEWGWGPWDALGAARIVDWEFAIRLSEGKIKRAFPCFSSSPFDEHRRHSIERTGEGDIRIRSYTSRKDAYAGNPNQSVVLELQAPLTAFIVVERNAPGSERHEVPIAAILEATVPMHVGPVPAESYMLHRIVRASESRIAIKKLLSLDDRPSYVYVRVQQRNGHMAWGSPVFINYARHSAP